MIFESTRRRLQAHLEQLRLALGRPDALIQLSLLGAVCGALAGLVIIALRLLMEVATAGAGLHTDDSFEQLAPMTRILLATSGGLLVGVIFQLAGSRLRQVGVVHVMERLIYHQGRLPAGNALMQFVGALVCLVSGHSVGREGPAIHLGAASGSLLGQSLGLPNNSNRLLVGAGCAGAIAAAFNTPLAGVIFAMEVVLMEYSLLGFTPVIVSAVTATAAARLVFGDAPAFMIPPLQAGHLAELPFVVALGLAAGLVAAAFIVLVQRIERHTRDTPVVLRFSAAGAVTGLVAWPFPEVMGIGYDTVNLTLLGQMGLTALLLLVLAKLLTTSVCIGVGMPGGLIGPSLVLGAAVGGAAGIVGGALIPSHASSAGYYALLGMGATMAAVLQAPLAALAAILELTYNPAVVLPGMLAIVSANLLTRTVFGKESIFIELMRSRGLDYRHTALGTALAGIGVTSVADRSFLRCPAQLEAGAAAALLAKRPRWLLIEQESGPPTVMPAADLANHCEADAEPQAIIELSSIPGRRLQTRSIDIRASLLEAHTLLQDPSTEVLLVESHSRRGSACFGVLTAQMLSNAYLPATASPPPKPDVQGSAKSG